MASNLREKKLSFGASGFIPRIDNDYVQDSPIVAHIGDTMSFLKALPSGLIQLIITSPPYNLRKVYENPKELSAYLDEQGEIIKELIRCLADNGSLCWQVGNFIDNGEVFPLDVLFYPIFKRNGVVNQRNGTLFKPNTF